jgi:ABC-type multidrug transport system permease subunit
MIRAIFKKNLLVLLKSRWWALAVIIGPLLLIFLSGAAFDNLNEYRLNIGIYSPTYNELTTSFIDKLNSDAFRTVKAGSPDECIDFIKLGISHACIIFPPDLGLGAQLTIYIDYSKLNLAWVVRDTLFSKVEERSTEITQQLTDNILSKLILARNEISVDTPLVIILEKQEGNITSIAQGALVIVGNRSYRLNVGDVSSLEMGVNASISTYWKLEGQALNDLKFASFILVNGDFSDDRDTELTADINDRKKAISVLNSYMNWLNSRDYSFSFNNTIDAIRRKTDTSNMVISLSEGSLSDIASSSDSNSNIIRRVKYSLENVGKELAAIDEYKAEDIAVPVSIDIKPITSYNTNLNYIFPTLMAMSIMLASLLLASIIVVMELNSPAFFRNAISPTKAIVFFFTDYLADLSIVGVQTVLMIIMSLFFFFSQIMANLVTTLFVCFFISTFFIILGMGIGYLFKTEQISILAATFTASIFLFFSNMLVPIENMPVFLTKIVQFNPFIISVSLIRKSILFGASFFSLATEIIYLILLTLMLLLLYFGLYSTKEELKK